MLKKRALLGVGLLLTGLLSACGVQIGVGQPDVQVFRESWPPAQVMTVTPEEKVVALATATLPVDLPAPTQPAIPGEETPAAPRESTADGMVSFELPQGWEPTGEPLTWSPDGGVTVLGLRRWMVEEGVEVEAALLPKDGVVMDAVDLTVKDRPVRRYLVEIRPGGDQSGEPLAVESHHLIWRMDNKEVFDFFLRAKSADDLHRVFPHINRVLESTIWAMVD